MEDIDLHVELPGREPYLIKTNVLVEHSHLDVFAGQLLPVWVDPDNLENVFIDWNALPTQEDMVQRQHRDLSAQCRQHSTAT